VGGDSELEVERPRSNADDAALWRRFRGVAGEDAKIGAFQRLKFGPQAPLGFAVFLPALLAPDPLRGEALMRDDWRIGAQRLVVDPGQPPWQVAMPSKHFSDRVHGFHWLDDLIGQGPDGAARACSFVDDWNTAFGRFNGFAWRLEPLAHRVWALLVHGETLMAGASADTRRTRLDALWRQSRFLEDGLEATQEPGVRWIGACVLVARALCLRSGQSLDDTLARLEAEMTAQILPDGGHVSRSPSRLLACLVHVLTLRAGLVSGPLPVPEFLERWIPRMAAMLAFFQTGDGGLMPFHDGDESRPETVAAVLAHVPLVRRFSVAPKSGFQKLEKSELRLVLDCGEAPPRPFSEGAHAGALSFDFSDGPARIVTSCGYSAEVNVDWQAAVRRTGAHSTLVLAGRDSATFVINEESRRLASQGPEGISAKRLEEANDIWLDAQHSGYKPACGLLHRRRLFVSGDGHRLTGEDSLARPISQPLTDERKPIPFEVRFHLHPTVTAMMSRDAIRLICDSGAVWRFKTSHPGTRLERTVYLARGSVERPEQIVLAGFADPNSDGNSPPNCIRWAFLKETQS
jgi:uncharacterized heparinase superfamily protein